MTSVLISVLSYSSETRVTFFLPKIYFSRMRNSCLLATVVFIFSWMFVHLAVSFVYGGKMYPPNYHVRDKRLKMENKRLKWRKNELRWKFYLLCSAKLTKEKKRGGKKKKGIWSHTMADKPSWFQSLVVYFAFNGIYLRVHSVEKSKNREIFFSLKLCLFARQRRWSLR